MKTHLLCIDAQKDFCDKNGSLYVTGAENDIDRLSLMIKKIKNKINKIHITMDSHHILSIFHSSWWIDINGNNPEPFTIIRYEDVKTKIWVSTIPNLYERSLKYVRELENKNKYLLCIWPNHTILGSEGHALMPNLFEAICDWEKNSRDFLATINFIIKGTSPYTENYSAISAEVVDPEDSSTNTNWNLIESLRFSDLIIVGGEASSHCILHTIKDLVNFDEFTQRTIPKKLILLEDAMSPVPTFEKQAVDFLKEMQYKGATVTTTDKLINQL